MNRLIHFFLLFILLNVLSSCDQQVQTEEKVLITEVDIDLDSMAFQKLYNFKDRWQTDSLLGYLDHVDPSYRTLAAQLLADLPDVKWVEPLGRLVNDPIVEVRRAALYALGQIRDGSALTYVMQIFQNQDSLGVDPLSFKYALEAVGKCGDSSYLTSLSTISTYQYEDELLLEGQCLGIFQMGVRGYTNDESTELMVDYLVDSLYPISVRRLAAQYLAYYSTDNLASYKRELQTTWEEENDVEIKMFLAETMGKTGNSAYQWLARNLRTEKDERVRIQLLKGSLYLPLSQMHNILVIGIRDRDLSVSTTAAEFMLERGSSSYSKSYTDWAFGNFPAAVKAKIFALVNKYNGNARFKMMTQQLLYQEYARTKDFYIKSELIKACEYNVNSQSQLLNWYNPDHSNIIKTSIIEALIYMGENRPSSLTSKSLSFLEEQWSSGDIAAVSLISPFIAAHPELFDHLAKDETTWSSLMSQLAMPSGVEAMISLKQAYATLFNKEYDPKFYQTDKYYTHPIDWGIYEGLSDEVEAEVVTDKGSFKIVLYKNHAPGTVVNFIELAEAGYYNDKLFHRVVPNFVVQGGGNRGDGYGSLDYTIRSELGPKYFDRSGLLGMASAGNHTESQQWFVTLRPTPHLNGKYTVFGKVVDNFDMILNLEIGDKIQKINIKK